MRSRLVSVWVGDRYVIALGVWPLVEHRLLTQMGNGVGV